MKKKDPLLRAAQRLLNASQERQARPNRRLDTAIENILYHAKLLAQRRKLGQIASAHGWSTSAAIMDERITDGLQQLRSAVSEAIVPAAHPPALKPTIRDLYQELIHLQEEFEQVTVDLKSGALAVATDAVELQDIYLGPFRIELHLNRTSRADVSAFDVVALDPHPPASSEDVTHPHVRDRQLCAGDATAPIAHALREGRICDAFLAINAVLHTYNRHSPYVSLDDWDGTPCADCGCSMDEEHSYYCDDCGQSFCDECFSMCDICQTSRCRGCLEKDSVSEQFCCKGCRRTCGRCGRMVDADSFESDTELCPGCHEQFLEEQQEEKPLPNEEIKNEQQHNSNSTDPSPADSLVPNPA